ncbi:unnamed protein product (mitochondrion) [Plasmodiophora brassicae]|uniref:Uncharacterized protein n=1 Tax=Plasmodiophora brassicae TaxID=37360 RepID=A0A3P3Y2E0_PLABS|nr:unnamed protein product [Plasmodiophora brassicae]
MDACIHPLLKCSGVPTSPDGKPLLQRVEYPEDWPSRLRAQNAMNDFLTGRHCALFATARSGAGKTQLAMDMARIEYVNYFDLSATKIRQPDLDPTTFLLSILSGSRHGPGVTITTPQQTTMIQNVFSGIITHFDCLSRILEGVQKSCVVSKGDLPLLRVLAYLILFRWDDIDIIDLHDYVVLRQKQDAVFIRFLLQAVVEGAHHLRVVMSQFYDPVYVQESILGRKRSIAPDQEATQEIAVAQRRCRVKSRGSRRPQRSATSCRRPQTERAQRVAKPSTVPQPFAFTQREPKRQPLRSVPDVSHKEPVQRPAIPGPGKHAPTITTLMRYEAHRPGIARYRQQHTIGAVTERDAPRQGDPGTMVPFRVRRVFDPDSFELQLRLRLQRQGMLAHRRRVWQAVDRDRRAACIARSVMQRAVAQFEADASARFHDKLLLLKHDRSLARLRAQVTGDKVLLSMAERLAIDRGVPPSFPKPATQTGKTPTGVLRIDNDSTDERRVRNAQAALRAQIELTEATRRKERRCRQVYAAGPGPELPGTLR